MPEVAHRRRSLPPLVFGVIVLAILGVWEHDLYADGCPHGNGRSIVVLVALVLATAGEAFCAHRRGAGAIKTICWAVGTAVTVAFLILVISFVYAGNAGCLPT